MLTGFVVQGLLGRDQVVNYPIQGSCFHVLLWSIIRLTKWLNKHKLQSRLVGQIHDSIIAVVHKDELEDYLEAANWIMTKAVRKAWDWIIVPLEVEAEVAPVGASWHEKEKVEI